MKKTLIILSTLLILALVTPISGQQQTLRIPNLAVPADLITQVTNVLPSKPGDTIVQLRNGMTVIIREKHDSQVVSSQILVKTGSIYEGKYFFGGLSHYLEHVVSGGSTESFSESRAQEMLKSLGGASNAYTSHDRTVYFINTAGEHYRKALTLLFSYVSESRLDPKEVAREKAVIQQEFKLGETNPGRQLWQLFAKTAYLEHPVRHPVIGYEDVFVTISREDLLDYYHTRYSPQNMVVTIVGDVRTSEALTHVLKLSKNMLRTFDPPAVIEKEPAQITPRWSEKSFPPARLTTMKIGFHTVPLSHQDLYPLDVLAIILGKGRTSRLYQELKDNEDLVLSVDASSWTPSYASGLFILSFSLDRKNVESTLASVWEEIGRVKKDLVKKRELEKAKRQVVADFVFSKQSASGMASSLASSFAATGDPYFDNKYVDRIREVSRKDIQRVARTYLRRQASTVSIVSPPGVLEESGEANARKTAGEIKKVTLENGLTLLLKRNPSVPIVAFKLFGHGGQRFELKGPDGISSFTMELLTKGTKSRTKRDIAETIEGLGGSLDSGSGRNAYYVSLAVLKDDLKIGLELLADVLQNPSFPQEEIEKQRQDTLLTIRRLDENWQNEVERIFRRHYYEHHPYGNDVIGSEEGIRQLNRNEIVEFYHRMVMPNNAVLAVFGDIEPEKTVAEIRSSLGRWRPGKPLKPIIPTVTAPLTADEQVRQETEKVSAAIYVGTNGLTLNDPDKPTLDVIDAVLSGIGYPSGWLHEALRGGDRSLVYVIHAFPSSGLKGGHFGVITQTTMANYPKVVDIILEKLEKIQQQPLQSKELEAAKDMVITMHELSTETIGAQARSAALNELSGLGYDWGERYPEIIQQVSTADVLRVARQLFRHHLLVSTIPEKPVEAIIPPEQKQRMHAQ